MAFRPPDEITFMKINTLRHVARCLGCVGILLALNSCVPIDPALMGGGGYGSSYQPQPSYRPAPNYGGGYENDRFGPETYNKGNSCGLADARDGRSANPSRHRGEYNSRYESSFVRGYNEGYAQGTRYRPSYGHDHGHDDHDHGRGNSGRTSNYFGGPKEWYHSGYMLGKRDRKNGASCNFSRHGSQYDSKTRGEFARGYEEGYSR
jgi:hypothetical protein